MHCASADLVMADTAAQDALHNDLNQGLKVLVFCAENRRELWKSQCIQCRHHSGQLQDAQGAQAGGSMRHFFGSAERQPSPALSLSCKD